MGLRRPFVACVFPFFLLLLASHPCLVESFGLLKRTSTTTARTTIARSRYCDALQAESSSSSSSSLSSSSDQRRQLFEIFPVLSRIHGINWEGNCRYVNGELQPQTNLLLTGGTRYDLQLDDENNDPAKATCTLTSFLTFPDGKTRQVQMVGQRGALERPSMRLDPTEEGPVYMVITEVLPDTILLNEIEKESGRTILTASLSIPKEGDELIQVSHEVGSEDAPIEGHQIWRLKKTVDRKEDTEADTTNGADTDGYRGTTGR
jgi:hypothetical protein